MLPGILNLLKKTRRDDGASVLELALVMGILGPVLLLGTLELSVYIYASIELTDATHAAASYAAQYYYKNSNSALPVSGDVTTAANNDAQGLVSMLKSGTSFTAAMATGCGSGDATAGSTVPTCTGSALPYVQVTGTATVAPIASFFAAPTLTMTSRARVNLVK